MRAFSGKWLGVICLTMALLVCAALRPAEAQGKKWALLVGINDYEDDNINPLHYAVADVQAVGETLQSLGFEKVFVMTSAVKDPKDANYPSAKSVLKRLQTLANQIGPDDTFLFYFSGHGFQRGSGSDQQFLGTIDADPTNTQTLRVSTLPMDVLGDQMRAIKAGQVVYIIDACRTDPDKNKGDGTNKLTDEFSRQLKKVVSSGQAGAKGTALLFACSVGERSYEWPAFGHGAFTHFLLEGLQGKAIGADGLLTVDSLVPYVDKQVREWDLETNHDQHPDADTHGTARIILAKGEPKPVPVPDDGDNNDNRWQPHTHKHLLVVTVTKEYRHDSIPVAEATIESLGKITGDWDTDFVRTEADMTEKMTAANLAKYDAVVFANTTGVLPLPDPEAFLAYIKEGHGFIAMHSGADTFHQWPNGPNGEASEYVKMLGAEFQIHHAFCAVDGTIVDFNFPATRPLLRAGRTNAPTSVPNLREHTFVTGKIWKCFDEIYLFKNVDTANMHVLIAMENHPDDHSNDLEHEPAPWLLAWCKSYGKGRVFYTSLGHRRELWQDPLYQQFITGGIRFALGLAKGDTTPNAHVALEK